jgi:hypothetical protein
VTSLGKQKRQSAQAERRLADQREADLVAVWCANGTRTSVGTGPGVLRLPQAEAGRLVANRLAIYGTEPPRGGHL